MLDGTMQGGGGDQSIPRALPPSGDGHIPN